MALFWKVGHRGCGCSWYPGEFGMGCFEGDDAPQQSLWYLENDPVTRWVHMVSGLSFSSVTDVRDAHCHCRFTPMPSLSRVMQRGHSLEP